MNSHQHVFRLTVLSAALAAPYGPTLAEELDVDELTKPESSVSVGIGNWSRERHQQGIYDGMRDNGAHGLLDADIVKRDESTGTWLKLKASNLGLDTREIKGEYLRQGDMGVSLEYSRTPYDNPNTYTTRLQGIGTTTQIVSTNAIPGPLQKTHLGTERDLTSLGFFKNLMPGLDFKVSFKNEEKTGTRAWGRGSASEFAVEPIDSTTRQLEATLNYATKKLQLSGGYYGSWYDTKNTLVTVYTGAAPTSPTYLSLPLDNQAHQLFLNGGYTFTPSTRGTFKLAYTRATQDESLPTQGISGLSLAGSPKSLNGEVNTTLVQLGLTSRPTKQLSWLANLRYHDVDDQTPINRFVQGNPASCVTPPSGNQCVDNTPLSYKTLSGKLEGTYRLPDGYSLTAGIEEKRQDRDIPVSNTLGAGGADNQRVVPFRYKLNETTYRVALRRSLSDTVNGTVAYLLSDRTGSSYGKAGTGAGGAASDYINPINIADRKRDKVRMALDWSPLDNLTIQFNIEDARDDYDHDNPYGVRKGTARLYGLDASYTISDKWALNAWYSYDQNQAEMFNSRTHPTSTKDSDLQDTGHSLGFGLRGEMTERLKLGADVQWMRNISKYKQELNAAPPANFTGDLPDIKNRMIRLAFFSQYTVDKNSEVRLDLIHERWKTNDWTWMFADGTPYIYASSNDGTTVTADQKQTSSFIGVRYIYKFQ